jgi:hypothetical protein
MTALMDHQFELLPSDDSADGVVFGIGADIDLDENGFHPPEDTWQIQDATNSRHGNTMFGRDVLQGPSWGWDLFTDMSDESQAVAAKRIFHKAWRALHIRQSPLEVIPLRMAIDGEVRRIYGRPRRYLETPTNRILSGYLPITVDFKAADAFTYSDELFGATLHTITGSVGGFSFPTTFPFTSAPPSEGSAQLNIEGDEAAYPVYRINGPITLPSLETEAWTRQFKVSVPDDDWIEIDTRPWKRTIRWKNGGVVVDALPAGQYVADMVLEPGRPVLTLRGNAPEGAVPDCVVNWRSTHNSY